MSAGGIIPSLGTKTAKPAECKITGRGSKRSAGQSLGVIRSGGDPMSTAWRLDCESGLQEKSTVYQTLSQGTNGLLGSLAPASRDTAI